MYHNSRLRSKNCRQKERGGGRNIMHHIRVIKNCSRQLITFFSQNATDTLFSDHAQSSCKQKKRRKKVISPADSSYKAFDTNRAPSSYETRSIRCQGHRIVLLWGNGLLIHRADDQRTSRFMYRDVRFNIHTYGIKKTNDCVWVQLKWNKKTEKRILRYCVHARRRRRRKKWVHANELGT